MFLGARCVLFLLAAPLFLACAEDPAIQARRWNNEAAALYMQGNSAAAERLYQAALALQPADNLLTSSISGNLAALYKHQNRYSEAEHAYRLALELRRKSLPPSSPDLADAMNNLAELYRLEGRYAEARDLTRAAVQSLQEFQPQTADLAIFLNNWGVLERYLHNLDRAEQLLRQSIELSTTVAGPESRPLAIALNDLAQVLSDRQDLSEAERLYQRSRAILEKLGSSQAHELATTLANQGRLLALLGRRIEGRETELRALTLVDSQPRPDELLRAAILRNLGNLAADAGNFPEALRYLDQALVMQERVLGPEHPSIAEVLLDYASAERHAGDKARARKLQNRAQRLLTHRPDDLSRYTVDVSAFRRP